MSEYSGADQEGKKMSRNHLIAGPADQSDGDHAFVASVIEHALEHMAQATQVIKDTQTSGGKRYAVKGEIPEVQMAFNAAASADKKNTSLLRQELDHYRDGLEWNKLCVVMYGPTNSGKSTIIEALSYGDGQTIGTGEKDYTQTSQEIEFGPLLLVDTPGIEGNEGVLRPTTQTSNRKAHVVLVIPGTAKEPEAGALSKLGEDAQRAGEVLSILNLRGRPSAYRYRRRLHTRSTSELEERIRQALLQVFADRYTEHLSLNAYLAFVTSPGGMSRFPDKQHRRDRKLTDEIFGSLDQAATLSGIGQLVAKLDELVREARPRILWSNGFKAITALGDVSSTLLKASSSMNKAAKLWNKAIRDAKAESSSTIKRSRIRVGQMISSRLSRLSNELKGTFKDGLDKGFSSSKLKQEFRCAIDDVKPDLQDIVDKELNVLREELKVEMNRLHERMNLRLFVTDFDLPDMDEILRDASLSVGREVIDVLLSVLGIVLLALANIIAAIVAGVMAVLRKLWEWFGGGKRKRKRAARTKARRQIDSEMTKIRKVLEDTLDEGWDKLGAQVSLRLNAAARLVSAFQDASTSLK
ncbi:MAG: 50S ribosome-binding GTPase, partial [Gemmatimonadota bacterium]|nr:50S ribosome-binding GTPase [Gemmatimonadota bacterium]